MSSAHAKHLAKKKAIKPFLSQSNAVLHIGCIGYEDYLFDDDVWLHSWIDDHAGDLVGIDLLEEQVERGQENGYEMYVEDAQDFDLGRQFDVIVAGNVIEHLPNPGLFLDCCEKHLTDDGVLLITTPHPTYLRSVLNYIIKGKHTPSGNHTMYFEESTMNRICELSDLSLVKNVPLTYNKTPKSLPGYIINKYEALSRRFGFLTHMIAYQMLYVIQKAEDY
ncbi:class I SAM-dependent methyltransferase [Salinadaptatus halalkaliphilus]|nr:methyltransferase domain-containing protein [Salinadaptatus halalkaliphilus]